MKIMSLALSLGLAVTSPAFATTFLDPFTSFYSFGDSLTDDGKFGQLDPPSLDGRFSNGRTWAELIADRFQAKGLDTGNLAQGGAVAGNVNANPAPPLDTFIGQIGVFANALATDTGLLTQVLPMPQFAPAAPMPGSNPLVSVWFGANDVFQAFEAAAVMMLDPADTLDFVGSAAQNAAASVAAGITALNSIDPDVFNDFLVVGLPDLGATPSFSGSPQQSSAGSAATDIFNAALAQNIGLLGNDINAEIFDPNTVLDEIFDGVLTDGSFLGITDVVTPCTINIGAVLNPNFSNPGSCLDGPNPIDPNSLLFVDGVHPNGTAHSLFASTVTDQFAITTIPVPASLPLMLSVLAGVSVIARRRQRL